MQQSACESSIRSIRTPLAAIRCVVSRVGSVYIGFVLLAGGTIIVAGEMSSPVDGVILAAYAALLWALFVVLVRHNVSSRSVDITTTPDTADHPWSDADPGNAKPAIELRRVDPLEDAVHEMSRRVKFEFRTLIESAIIGVVVLQDGRFRFANRAAAALVGVGCPEDLVRLESAVALLPETDRERAAGLLARLQTRPGAHARLTVPFPGGDDSRHWIQWHVQQVPWRGRSGLMASLVDVSRQKRLEDDLRHHATYDALTGVANRRHFIKQATMEIERARRHRRPLALLLLDLDYFKRINDTLGHAAGDKVLKLITGTIRHHLRSSDLVARIGGEEFVVLLPDTDLHGAVQLAERLRVHIRVLTIDDGQRNMSISVSIGVADSLGSRDATISDALCRVDEALYRAKREGRDRVFVAQSDRQKTKQ